MKTIIYPACFIILFGGASSLSAQQSIETGNTYPNISIKTNLLYDATATFNLGAEVGLGQRTSLDIPVSYNPWTFSDNMKWKHLLVQPGYRWWTSGWRFKGGFWGVHAHYGIYNVGALPSPLFSDYMNTHRFEGWLAGAGVSYGYRWNLGRHKEYRRWALEAEIGVGYAYLSYDTYPCCTCGAKIGSDTKNYFGPTKVAVNLVLNIGKKPAAPTVAPAYIPSSKPAVLPVPALYEPQLAVSYITPQAAAEKRRSQAGKAYLDFAVGRSDIRPAFMSNAAELEKIHSLIGDVKGDPASTITGITITGYASPEGSYATNMALSLRRATAFKEYLRSLYGLDEAMCRVEGRGEDWVMLDTLVSQSDLADRHGILAIIRGNSVMDKREKELKSLDDGAPYRQMLAEMFPQLRRVEYQLNYTVQPFTVEQGKEVFKTRSATLSLNEMFLIAQTYTPGSQSFNELFDTAARIFPASDEANLNAAASSLARKDVVSAEKYLAKVRTYTGAWYNNMGILSYLKGDLSAAALYLDKAAAAGDPLSPANAAEMRKVQENRAEIERVTRQNREAQTP